MARNDIELLKEAKKVQAEKIELQKKSIALTEQETKQLESLIERQEELKKEFRELRQEKLDAYKNEESSIKSMGSLYDGLADIQKQTTLEASIKGKFNKDQITSITKIQEINRSIAQLGVDDVEARKALTNEYNDQMETLGQNFHGNTKVIQQLKSQNSLANDYANISSEQKEIIQKQHDVLDGISKTIRGTLMTITTLYGNVQGAIGGIITAMGFVVDKIGAANRELGTTLFQVDGVGRKAGVLSFIFDDAVGTAKNLSAELGSTDRATFGLQTNVGLMAMNMGISNGEAATLVGSFTRLNGNSTDIASDMVATSREFAKQNGIIPAQLMGDLANSAEEFALFGKEGGKNILEAAGFAAKLGVNMKTISGVADNLLDFESSITKELELGAMLGRNINLNKARELAFTGDIEGAAKETLKALGGQAAFERMNYYQKKQTADLMGVSVAELQKMVANEQQAANLGGVISKNFSQAGEFLNAGLNKYLGTSLKTMGGMITAGAQLGANFKQMGGSFEPITKGIKNIGAKLGGATDSISSGVGSTSPSVSRGANPAAKGGMMDSMSKINMSAVLKGAAAMVLVAGAVYILGKALQEYTKVGLNEIASAAGGMLILGASIAALGYLIGNPAVATGILLGAAAMVVVASSIYILGKALQEMGKGFELIGSVGSQITQLTENIVPIMLLTGSLFALAGALTAVGTAGLISIPGLVALGAIGTAVRGINSLLGIESETTTAVIGGGNDEDSSLSQYQTDTLKYLERIAVASEKGATIKARDRSAFNPIGINND